MAADAPAVPIDFNEVAAGLLEFARAGHDAAQQLRNNADLHDVDYDEVVAGSGDESLAPPEPYAEPVPPPGGYGVAVGVRFRSMDHADVHVARWFNRTRKRLQRGPVSPVTKVYRQVDGHAPLLLL